VTGGGAEPRLSPDLESGDAWFAEFEGKDLARLCIAFTAAFGSEAGSEAAAEVAAYAWEHRDRLASMENPSGYLYRVGQSTVRRLHRWQRSPQLPPVSSAYQDVVDPDLPRALAKLSRQQRQAVVLVHVNGWTYPEAAEALGVDVSTVRTHVSRALVRLRRLLGEV